MKQVLTSFLLIGIVACGGLKGRVQNFEVKKEFSLQSDSSHSEASEVVHFSVGDQNPAAWLIHMSGKKEKPQFALIRSADHKSFSIDQDRFSVDSTKAGQTDATTPWQEESRACTYTETYTYCSQLGHCTTYSVIKNGFQIVRVRTTGTYDLYQLLLNEKTDGLVADLNVEIDNTHLESQALSGCR